MNTYESEKRNSRRTLRGYDDSLFDQADTPAFSSDSSSLPEPTVVTGDEDESMVCDCCGCREGEL